MRTVLLTAFAIASNLIAGNSVANDSTARVGAGGIVLLKNNDIRMEQEALEVSTKAIRVNYRFKNETSANIQTTVAFPLPSYGWNPGESAYDGNVGPLRAFNLVVDGTKVKTNMIRKAEFQGQDITKALRSFGLTDSQIFETFGDCGVVGGLIQCGLTTQQKAKVTHLLGRGHNSTDWKVAETVHWEQIFPAGQSIEVQHEYKPFVGMTYGYPYQDHHPVSDNMPWAATSKSQADSEKEACLDEDMRKAINKRVESQVRKGSAWVQVVLHDVEYILGTGRNWKGPISEFRLRIVKESEDQVVSLCFPGKPRIVNATTLEFSHRNFVPQDRLVVHFYTVLGAD